MGGRDMKHLFVPYELALKLKEKGFKAKCFAWYDHYKDFYYCDIDDDVSKNTKLTGKDKSCCTAPLYQQVMDWFRERHKIMIELHWQEGTQNYSFCYGYKAGKWFFPKETFEYYKALGKAIEEALKLI